jgi:predicted phage baseplate assembly protein
MIRFGNDEFGMAPPDGSYIYATYRVGVGPGGNVGSESLVHVIDPGTSDDWPDITAVRNPLAAWGGKGEEPVEQVKQLAPAAFRAEQLRAVTEEDYARAAEKHTEVSKAVATFRWTGSWHTVFITIDPVGRTDVPSELERSVRDWVTRYTQTSYDLEIDPPTFVPLEIEADVCVAPGHFRSDVEEALLVALGNQPLPGGGRGFFHPNNFTFGQALYISRLYAAIEAVSGVDSAEVIKFQRLGKVPNKVLDQGYIPMDRLEVVRLDNDPSLPENGVVQLNMLGGK